MVACNFLLRILTNRLRSLRHSYGQNILEIRDISETTKEDTDDTEIAIQSKRNENIELMLEIEACHNSVRAVSSIKKYYK